MSTVEISKLKTMTLQQILDLLNTPEAAPDETVVDTELASSEGDDVSAVTVKIASISDSPEINFTVSDNNLLVLEALDHSPGTCSNSSIQLLGKKMYMNVCDDDGKPYIHLNIEVSGKFLNKVRFFVTDDSQQTNTIDSSILNA